MNSILAGAWWLLLLRGVIALMLWSITVLFDKLQLHELPLVFLGYAILDAIVNLAGAIMALQKQRPWGFLMGQAAAGLVAALLVVAWTGLTITGLILIISCWGFVTGVLGIAWAAALGKHRNGKSLLALTGMASIALTMEMVTLPLELSEIRFWLGTYAFVFGTLLVVLAFRIRPTAETRARVEARRAA
jgi:uncharacterized membrane protein HdeD (DUF308 family)